MLEFKKITIEELSPLKQFLAVAGDSLTKFRYFKSRELNSIKNHHRTYLLFNNDLPVCYGHLDNDDGVTWLGIATIYESTRKGYGNKMMAKLIEEAKALSIKEIFLTVDKDNIAAIKLYEKFGFSRMQESADYYKYKLQIR